MVDKSLIVTVFADVLVMVTAWPALGVPNGWSPKSTLEGTESARGGGGVATPLPTSGTSVGELVASLTMCSDPVNVATPPALNVTCTAHTPPDCSDAPQRWKLVAPVSVGSSVKPLPVTLIEPMLSVALPTLVMTKSCGELVVPTSSGAKSPEPGETWMMAAWATSPVPDNATVCGLPAAFVATVSVPARVPVAIGVKVTSIVQLAPTAREFPHDEVKAKSPLTVIEEIASAPGPLLVRVTVCAGLVVDLVRAANASEDGAVEIVGEGAAGVTAFDGADAGPGPATFLATTVNVYVVPLASPVTVMGDAGPDAVMPLGLEVTT
jgi:hypothetical protein